MARSRRALARTVGPLTIVLSVVGVIGPTFVAPWFSWTGNALSDLGAAGAGTALVFNATLVVTGFLGIVFVWGLFPTAASQIQWIAFAVMGASFVALSLIGVFPLPSAWHAPPAVGFFLGFTLAIGVDALAEAREGNRRIAIALVGLVVVHVLGWAALGVTEWSGVAIPELVGSVALWAWVAYRYATAR